MDRFSAAGAERKAAQAELPRALSAVRHAESAYHNFLKSEIAQEQGARTRMAIGVPGLSDAAQKALQGLAASQTQDRAAQDRAQQSLTPEVMAEFKAVNAALDKRFGYQAFANATEASAKELVRAVTPAQRPMLDKLCEQMKTLQQAVHRDIAQKHQQAQKLRQSTDRGPTLIR